MEWDRSKKYNRENSMKFTLALSILLLGSACSSIQVINDKPKIKNKVLKEKVEEKLVTEKVLKGKVKLIQFAVDQNDGTFELKCIEQGSKKPLVQNIPFVINEKKATLYYAEGYFSQAKSHHCFFQGKQYLAIDVENFPYKKE